MHGSYSVPRRARPSSSNGQRCRSRPARPRGVSRVDDEPSLGDGASPFPTAPAVPRPSAARYRGSHDELQPSPGEAPSGRAVPRRARGRATGLRVRRPALRTGAGAGAGGIRDHAREHRDAVHARVHRAAARAVLPLPGRRRPRGADPRARVPGGGPRGRGADDAVHRRARTSTSRNGRATRSRSRCPTRSCADPTAPGCAASAGRT